MKLKQLKKQIISKDFKYIIKSVQSGKYYLRGGLYSLTKYKEKATVFHGKEELHNFLKERPQYKVGRFYRICTIGFFYKN